MPHGCMGLKLVCWHVRRWFCSYLPACRKGMNHACSVKADRKLMYLEVVLLECKVKQLLL